MEKCIVCNKELNKIVCSKKCSDKLYNSYNKTTGMFSIINISSPIYKLWCDRLIEVKIINLINLANDLIKLYLNQPHSLDKYDINTFNSACVLELVDVECMLKKYNNHPLVKKYHKENLLNQLKNEVKNDIPKKH